MRFLLLWFLLFSNEVQPSLDCMEPFRYRIIINSTFTNINCGTLIVRWWLLTTPRLPHESAMAAVWLCPKIPFQRLAA
jgi:hypothetical protein